MAKGLGEAATPLPCRRIAEDGVFLAPELKVQSRAGATAFGAWARHLPVAAGGVALPEWRAGLEQTASRGARGCGLARGTGHQAPGTGPQERREPGACAPRSGQRAALQALSRSLDARRRLKAARSPHLAALPPLAPHPRR